MRSEGNIPSAFRERKFNRYSIPVFLILVLFFYVNLPALKLGLPYVYHRDEKGTMIPVLHALKTGNFNQFETPQETRIYDGYAHWAILGVAFINYIIETSRGEISGPGDFYFSTSWDQEVSHPSFYLIGRLVILIFGLICLYLLYRIASESGSKATALLAIFILALLPKFGFYSTKALPYVPMTL